MSQQKKIAATLAEALALLEAESTLTLATIGDGRLPDATPLFYLPDKELNLYWLSAAASRHSASLARSPEASIAVHRPTMDWRQIRGLAMRGTVQPVTERAGRRRLLEAYGERYALPNLFRLAVARSTLYAFTPVWLRLTDNGHGFGAKRELTRSADGWQLTHSEL